MPAFVVVSAAVSGSRDKQDTRVARRPDDVELKAIVDFYESQLKRFRDAGDKSVDAAAVALPDPKQVPSGMDLPELAAWTTVARSILNLDETVTKE